jgi:multiple sugar transport system substrate-binding protein
LRISGRLYRLFWAPALLAALAAVLLAACVPNDVILRADTFAPAPITTVSAETSVSDTETTASATVTPTPRPSPIDARTPTLSPAPTLTPTPTLRPVALEDLRGLTVRILHPWVGETASALAGLAAEFNSTNPWGISVVLEQPGSSAALADAIQEGHQPDGVAALPEQVAAWQAQHRPVVNLSGMISSPEWGLDAGALKDIPAAFWQSGQPGGPRWGMPALRTARILFYNTTWAGELGFTHPPQTPEEFRKQACKAAQANSVDQDTTNDGTGGWLVDDNALTLLSWISAFGGKVTNATGDAYQFQSTPAVEALTFLKQLESDGCAWVGRDSQPFGYFARRYALFVTANLENYRTQEAALADPQNKPAVSGRLSGFEDNWTMLPFPVTQGEPVIVFSGPSWSIFAGQPERELATWLFIRWLVGTDQQARFASADGELPVRVAALSSLPTGELANPQWQLAQPWLLGGLNPPGLASWQSVHGLLEDAATQLFQAETTVVQVPQILAEMDAMAKELAAAPGLGSP